MKKLLLIATISLAGFVNAKSTIVKEVKTSPNTAEVQLCGVVVTFYDLFGQPAGQRWYTSDQPTLDACQSYQDGVIANLRSQGYRVERQNASIAP